MEYPRATERHSSRLEWCGLPVVCGLGTDHWKSDGEGGGGRYGIISLILTPHDECPRPYPIGVPDLIHPKLVPFDPRSRFHNTISSFFFFFFWTPEKKEENQFFSKVWQCNENGLALEIRKQQHSAIFSSFSYIDILMKHEMMYRKHFSF